MTLGHLGPSLDFFFYMSSFSSLPFTVGKFLITPLIRSNNAGRFSAALSIRRGQGTQTHDRVYTFKPDFASKDSALVYAAAQGRYWMLNPASFT
jgi:hypothetical protein